jgi:hypothetical protein
MSGPAAPMLALGIVSYGNNWYNTGSVTDVKPLLFAGIATIFLEGFAAIPGMTPVATALGWAALLGFILSPAQNPSPVQNLLKLTPQGKKANG